MDHSPLWTVDAPPTAYPLLGGRELRVDVLVVGGGITGVLTALLLKQAGRSVALLERGKLGSGATGHTTAHATHVTDRALHALRDTFGHEEAAAAWHGNALGMDFIAQLVREHRIPCGLHRVPGFLFAPSGSAQAAAVTALRKDAALATEMGFDAAFLTADPLYGCPAVRFANQFAFHPLQFLHGVAALLPGDGCELFEDTDVVHCESSPRLALTSEGGRVHFQHLVLATHVPLQGLDSRVNAALLQSKLAAYSSYVVSARLPRGTVPEAVFWDTNDPYRYLRVDRLADRDSLLYGGEDHRTGQQADTLACYAVLESSLRERWPKVVCERRWSGQVIETPDGLPYIGETVPGQFVATGFGGNGTTFGALAALLISSEIVGRRSPLSDLFSPDRKKCTALGEYLRENTAFPYYFLKDHLAPAETARCDQVLPGQGALVHSQGKKLAVYRDDRGRLSACSATCPHLGCCVAWNEAESTWDCPCHGSRFSAVGALLSGPAESSLELVEIGPGRVRSSPEAQVTR